MRHCSSNASRHDNRRRARVRRLAYTTDREPGITRRRAGKGFAYRGPEGALVRDAAILARIRSLAVPPAYTDVWICRDPRGHLQATGRDARGRKQYRYHAEWREYRDARKYRRLVHFGERLPALRACLRRDLARPGLGLEKVLALMARVMMATSVRVGGARYARENHSYGLATLRKRHAGFSRDGRAKLHFRGKGGKQQQVSFANRRLVRLLRQCHRLPGDRLFQYDDGGVVRAAGARQFNAYLHAAMGARFSAKDFRTWTGTLIVLAQLVRTPLPKRGGERAVRGAIATAIAVAATELGNTPAVCRKAYVCPQVLAGWRGGELQRRVRADVPLHSRRLEASALRFLKRGLGGRDRQPPQRSGSTIADA